MARFKPGESGNRTGRPKGAKNKVQRPLKEEISGFLSEQWPQIKRDFKKLEPAARMAMFEKLARFVLPQPRETAMNINFDQLTDAQIDQILDKLFGDENKG
jgi:thymidylate synthase ThyX